MMRICGGLKGPSEQQSPFKVLILHKSWARIRFLEAAFGHRGRPDALRGALWCHFGVIGGHFGATLESLWSSLGPLYVYECDFKFLLRDFQIIFIFPIYLNGFIKLRGRKEYENH